MDPELFVKAGMVTPEVTNEVFKVGKNPTTATTDDWVAASPRAAVTWDYDNPNTFKNGTKAITVYRAGLKNAALDPFLYSSLPSTEIWNSTYSEGQSNSRSLSRGNINYSVLTDFRNAYDRLEQSSGGTVIEFEGAYKDAQRKLASYPKLEKSVYYKEGVASFGEPEVFKIDETDLKPPLSLIKKYDLYLLELKMTFKDLNYGNLNELVFGVTSSANVRALKLIPLNIGNEVTTEKRFEVPEVKGGFEGVEIGIGSIYGEEISMRFLKPKILGSGLGEHEFYWSMTDDAVHKGSRNFFVFLGVPKGTKEILLRFWASIKYKDWYFSQGNWARAEPLDYSLRFPGY